MLATLRSSIDCADPACTADDTDSSPRQYGVELTADQWQPWDPLDLSPQYLAVCFLWLRLHNPHVAVYHDAEAATVEASLSAFYCDIPFWQHT